MAKFKFTAVDSKGKESSGTIEADSQDQAFSLVREQGLFVTQVAPAAGLSVSSKKEKKAARKAKKGPSGPKIATSKKKAQKKGKDGERAKPGFGAKVKPKELTVFTRQLATLVEAGLPLIRGLEVLERQSKNPLIKYSVLDMADSISAGSTFAEALAQHPKMFDKLYVNMVKAGEMGGVLDKVLVSLAMFMEKIQKIKSKVVSAMVYPAVVLTMAVGILIFLMVFIIPRFEKIFDDLLGGEPLPGLTRVVLAVSRTVTGNLHFVVLAVVLLVIALKLIKKTDKGRYYLDKFKLNAPVFGDLLKKTSITRFCRTLSTLMDSGVPVLQALLIVRDTSGNEVIAKAVNMVHDSVKEGENIAPPIEASGIFPPMVVSMIEVGEETGELPQMLSRIADNYEDEVDNAVAAITSIIEPILIIFLAVIVGTIVISLFLPLISIITNLG